MNTAQLAAFALACVGMMPNVEADSPCKAPQQAPELSPAPPCSAADWEQLEACIRHNDVPGLLRLLEQGMDPNRPPALPGRAPALHAASFYCSEKMLAPLVEHGADINGMDSSGNTALMKACQVKQVKWLLDLGANAALRNQQGQFALMGARDRAMAELLLAAAPYLLHRADAEGNTPLLTAAGFLAEGEENPISLFNIHSYGRSQEVVDFLLEQGASPHAANKKGETALMLAARGGNRHAVQALLAAGADATGRDQSGKSALTYAMENGYADIAALLEQHGAPAGNHCAFIKAATAGNTQALRHWLKRGGIRLEACGLAALEGAASHGHAETAQMLVDAGVNPDSRDRLRRTLLFRASQRGDLQATDVLLALGADVNAPSSAEQLPLTEAARQGNLAMVKRLLAHGSHLGGSLCGDRGIKPLSAAVESGQSDVLKTLLEAEADPDALFEEAGGRIKVQLLRQPELVRILLDAGAHPNMRAKVCGQSPMDSAMRNQCYDTAMLLLKYGADANETDNYNRNMLFSAACAAPVELVAELLKRGAEPNLISTVPGHQQTALINAVSLRKQDSPEVVRLLLEAGADPCIRDSQGKTALDHALEKGYTDSAALLQPTDL